MHWDNRREYAGGITAKYSLGKYSIIFTCCIVPKKTTAKKPDCTKNKPENVLPQNIHSYKILQKQHDQQTPTKIKY